MMPQKKPIVEMTPAAANRIKGLLQRTQDQGKKEAVGMRIKLKTRGCSGLAYDLECVYEPLETDEKIQVHGVTLYVDSHALIFLAGTQMDYEDNLLKSGFVFKNPKEKGRCGCGESFHV